MPLLKRLPAYAVNGIAVALGVALIHFLFALVAGPAVAQIALGGAVCASLADVPNTVPRTRSRVPVAALLGVLATLTVALLHPHPIALGFGIAGIAFVAMMTMAWGPRAGAVSFAPILALVFAMAVPVGAVSPWHLAGWTAAGAALYCGWAVIAGAVVQPRLRTLSLVQALRGTAELFVSRAALLRGQGGALEMRAWIAGEAAAAERLQTARDFIFAAPDTPVARRNTAILLGLIDLRDLLLASRLDLDLLGDDTTGRAVLDEIADTLARIGVALDDASIALRDGDPLPTTSAWTIELRAAEGFADDDPRRRLVPAIHGRFVTLRDDVARIQSLLDADPAAPVLTHTELQHFVAPEGWPLGALRDQFTMRSPVFRHALRATLALGSAYFIARALPWTSHPHWLVLGVAVVLRGNLEQTLSRRNARVMGTFVGCAVVLGLSLLHSPAVMAGVFIVAVGAAHAFVLQRYWVTALAATVMALMQAHAMNPAAGFAIGERVADTVLGAALAWAFSYVLPSWEKRHLPAALSRTLKELSDYTALALAMPPVDGVAPRLARRRAYDALTALAGVVQRTGAEPATVRVPVAEVARVLDHGQRLMAHLSVVRMILARRRDELDADVVAPAIEKAVAAVGTSLSLDGADIPAPAERPGGLSTMPVDAPARDVLPWLLRRLDVLAHDAGCIAAATRDALARRP